MGKVYAFYVLVGVCWCVRGEIDEDMRSIMDECCSVGSEFGRSHTEEDCAASQPVPSVVPSSFRSIYLMCIMARAVCCTGHVGKSHFSHTSTESTEAFMKPEITTSPHIPKSNSENKTSHVEQTVAQQDKKVSNSIEHHYPKPEKRFPNLATVPNITKSDSEYKTSHFERLESQHNKKVSNSFEQNYQKPENRFPMIGTSTTSERSISRLTETTTSIPVSLVTQPALKLNQIPCIVSEDGNSCACPRGYRYTDNNICEDIDECTSHGSSALCFSNSDCVNTIGSFNCICHRGLRHPLNDSSLCVDIDECLEDSTNNPPLLCQQYCKNTLGSYSCFCFRGYNNVNGTCVDDNECEDKKSIGYSCQYKCLNEPGSYRCICPKGYTRSNRDYISCTDINECETGEASCQNSSNTTSSSTCYNTGGSYSCINITCPSGYQLNETRCSKTSTACPEGDEKCLQEPKLITHQFTTFASKLYLKKKSALLFTTRGSVAKWPFSVNCTLRSDNEADIKKFSMIDFDSFALLYLVGSIEGPRSIELEISMEYRKRGQFVGTALHKFYIYVSEYEF